MGYCFECTWHLRLSRHSYQNYLLVLGTTVVCRGSNNQHDENEFLDNREVLVQVSRVLRGTNFEVKASYQGTVVDHGWLDFTIAKCVCNG